METKSRAFDPLRDAKKLHVNGTASVGELKEFLATLHGRSPQEVIGIVSSSLLVQSLVVALVATLIFFALFTVGPYYVYGPPKKPNLAAKPDQAIKQGDAKDGAANDSQAPAKGLNEGVAAGDANPAKSNAGKAAKALGIDEVKSADPGKNPLDKGPNIDNLLDGLDK